MAGATRHWLVRGTGRAKKGQTLLRPTILCIPEPGPGTCGHVAFDDVGMRYFGQPYCCSIVGGISTLSRVPNWLAMLFHFLKGGPSCCPIVGSDGLLPPTW